MKPSNEVPWYLNPFIQFCVACESLILLFFGLFGVSGLDGSDLKRYPMFQDVHVMIFIGFGFLMTFLRKFGYSAVGFTLFIGAISLQTYPLLQTFWRFVLHGHSGSVPLTITMLIQADFCAGAQLIAFGALIGNVSHTQIGFLSVTGTIFYALNESIAELLGIADAGGSMLIHAFGAFFGLAASLVIAPRPPSFNADNASVYHSDLFAMIGTVFLWIYWPSFNAALTDDGYANRAVVNTVLSLTGSCIAAYATSLAVTPDRKFSMVHIQNATLAGGVSMGTAANMAIHPGLSLTIGIVAGVVSVLGYHKVLPTLSRSIGLQDTCGVLNLHGMPSVLGALWGLIGTAVSFGEKNIFLIMRQTKAEQVGYQMACLVVTIHLALASGALCGFLAKRFIPGPKARFTDESFWEVPEQEIPFFFDQKVNVTMGVQSTAAMP